MEKVRPALHDCSAMPGTCTACNSTSKHGASSNQVCGLSHFTSLSSPSTSHAAVYQTSCREGPEAVCVYCRERDKIRAGCMLAANSGARDMVGDSRSQLEPFDGIASRRLAAHACWAHRERVCVWMPRLMIIWVRIKQNTTKQLKQTWKAVGITKIIFHDCFQRDDHHDVFVLIAE